MTTETKPDAPAQPADKSTPDEVIAAQRMRQTVILTAVIIALALLIGISRWTRAGESKVEPVGLVPGTTENPAFKREDVGQVEIRRGADAPLILHRDGDKGWRIPSKFNAPADSHDIDMLLDKVFSSKRLGKPSTEDTTNYPLYSLADDEAVQLRLCDANGKELLKLLVGKIEDGSRDFIRLTGEDAPAGIFELANSTGSWDSLVGRMNLDSERRPDAKRWLDLTGFKAVPAGARTTGVIIQDADSLIEIKHDAADDKKWEIVRPGRFAGEGTAIQGMVSAIEGLSAVDIAGKDTDAAALGIEGSKRKLTLEYTNENKPGRAVLTFGNVKDSQVAIHVTTADQGSTIYWVADYVLQRAFRKLTDLTTQSDLALIPVGRNAEHVKVTDGEKLLEMVERKNDKGGKEWALLKPVEGKADPMMASTLMNHLNTLRGARALDKPDVAALGVTPESATRRIELTWSEPGVKKEGEATAPDVKRTVTLSFGTTVNDVTPVITKTGTEESLFFWLPAEAVNNLFAEPGDYHFFDVKVRHILITWKGKTETATPKDPERTEEQARKLAAEIETRAKEGEDFTKMQLEYNEDSVADKVYDVNPASGLVEPFKKLAASLPPGGVGICESQFGLHVMKRVE